MTADGEVREKDVLPPWSVGRVLVAVLALALMIPLGVFYLAGGLLVPMPWLALLWLVYVGLLVATVLLVRRRSWWVPVVPVLGAAIWWTTITLGEQLGGWTA